MKVAVIGSGIGGVGAAWLLSAVHDVDVYEAESWLGGHTRTIEVEAGGRRFPVDTGFMVFNRRTYPNLTRFFEHLGIDAHDADMSFSVQVPDEGIEWAGTNVNTVFAQRRNIANPRFLRMLTDILRLSRDSQRLLADPSLEALSLGQLLRREGYSDAFVDWYLIPMGDAIWSTPPGKMLDYPALTFLRFCDNHGLLRPLSGPQWLSVPGGARRYVEAASRSFSGEVYIGEPAERVERTATQVRVHTPTRVRAYDAVVLATHPPQSRELLGEGMSMDERSVLEPFDYWPNDVVVHTDESFLPKCRRAWSSWNWYSAHGEMTKEMLMLTYRLNTLQRLPSDAPSVMVTLNRDRDPAEGSVLTEISFDHPMYSKAAVVAQSGLPRIQGADRVWFAGAWTRYGFHEDGLLSGVRVAEALGATVPWGADLDESRTRVRADAPVPALGQARPIAASEAPPTFVPEPAPSLAAGAEAGVDAESGTETGR